MKILKFIIVGILAFFAAISCNEGIDPITEVAPGADELAPTVKISYPAEGELLKVAEGKNVSIGIEAVDDIELKSVSVIFDGKEISSITSFKDYRRYAPIDGYIIDGVGNGSHTIQINAIDRTGKSTLSPVVSFDVIKIAKYDSKYGEIFYMSFDNHLFEFVSLKDAKMVGTTGYDDNGKIGKAYAGAKDSYITFPTTDLLGTEFSATFWYNLNPVPARSGIMVIGPPDPAAPKAMNNRLNGFRLFREGGATNQVIKLNVGNGVADGWFDGGAAATIDPTATDWVFMAFSIGIDHVALYINGEIVSEGAFGPVDWTGCDILSIASGAPRFTGWEHFSDLSLYDELRIFKKALTQDEIKAIMNTEI